MSCGWGVVPAAMTDLVVGFSIRQHTQSRFRGVRRSIIQGEFQKNRHSFRGEFAGEIRISPPVPWMRSRISRSNCQRLLAPKDMGNRSMPGPSGAFGFRRVTSSSPRSRLRQSVSGMAPHIGRNSNSRLKSTICRTNHDRTQQLGPDIQRLPRGRSVCLVGSLAQAHRALTGDLVPQGFILWSPNSLDSAIHSHKTDIYSEGAGPQVAGIHK